jgi:anti-anti-sigma factor
VDVQVSFADRVPVLTLSGRFDGFGALQFDEAAQGITGEASFWILDFAGVSFMSSVGLRSIVELEKTLRARDGGLILMAIARSVRQLLEISRLDNWLRLVTTIDEAVAMVRASTSAPATSYEVSGRAIRVRRVAETTSSLEWWKAAANGQLVTATLPDLGFAFGLGCVGDGVAEARAGLGAFVSTPLFAGVLPTTAHGVSDFITGGVSATLPVHVQSALSVCGAPALVAEVSAAQPFRLLDLIGDVSSVAGAELGANPPALGFVVIGDRSDQAGACLAVGIAHDSAAPRSADGHDAVLREWPGQMPIAGGRTAAGGAVTLRRRDTIRVSTDVIDAIRSINDPNLLNDVVELDADAWLSRATIWLFVPSTIRGGAEKLLKIAIDGDINWRPEWDAIVRRLYADCQSVALTPLHGGYNSKTFRASAYDREGRRTLPTVLKIGPLAITAREEVANREYVSRFILNNGTTVLGGAEEGEWAGLRYNFLGVNGPDSRLVWLREHYLQRPTEEVLALFDTLLTRVLKPWYAQPKWEQVWLYRDHTPLRLFPKLLEVAERDLGLSCDALTFDCPELGLELPNPMRFLKHEYARRTGESRLWYTAICHGDLNLQNVLVDERENLYVIDFSETRPRNAVSDFARIEPIVKFEFPRLETDEDLRQLLEFEEGLMRVTRLSDTPPFIYRGNDPLVARAHAVITRLRRSADIVTLFEQDMTPYWLAMLEWTYSVICYVQLSSRHKRYAVCSAALICRAIQKGEST